MTLVAASAADVREAVLSTDGPLLPVAGATKPALSTAQDTAATPLDVSALRGITSYDPAELTFTARAGTPVREAAAALAEHGQYLPFDPPLADAGATLGGAVAAGVSGSGAFRHGGVRDFIIGVRLVDGTGSLIAGGGQVVKNAAGFDLPKLMVGSAGRLGVLTELSFKVFPHPRAKTTLSFEPLGRDAALATVARLARGPVALDALDVEPTPDGSRRILARIGGDPAALDARAVRLASYVEAPHERLAPDEETALWRDTGELRWAAPGALVARIPVTAPAIPMLDAFLAAHRAAARWTLGANAVWVAWPAELPPRELGDALAGLGLTAVALTGTGGPLLGARRGGAFAARVRGALDPDGRFAGADLA